MMISAQLLIPLAVLCVGGCVGWIISVERRITTLQAMAGDIHEMKDMMKEFVGRA